MASKNKNLAELIELDGDIVVSALDNVDPSYVSDKSNSSTGGFSLPAGTTAQRPGSPDDGETRYNSDIGSLEFYDGANWIATNLIPTVDSISGVIYAGASSDLTLSLSNATDSIDVVFKESGSIIETVAGVSVTSGSATVTVPAAVYGQTAGDTIVVSVNNNDGTPSSNAPTKTVIGLPTGGTITTSGGYRYHKFTSSGTLTVPSAFASLSKTAEYILVAGGGAGGTDNSGGGGAGGLIDSSTTLSSTSYSITIGAGGAGSGTVNTAVNSGSNSTAFGSTANGGGKGGTGDNDVGHNGASGGSGGGGASEGTDGTGGSGTSGQGNDGGDGANSGGGGGGGAGAAGQDGNARGSQLGGNGGIGLQFSTWATATSSGDNGYYAGGGAGGNENDVQLSNLASGGAGGGGDGFTGSNRSSGAGQANTGGGGAGGTYTNSTCSGADGGSGICLVRYQL